MLVGLVALTPHGGIAPLLDGPLPSREGPEQLKVLSGILVEPPTAMPEFYEQSIGAVTLTLT